MKIFSIIKFYFYFIMIIPFFIVPGYVYSQEVYIKHQNHREIKNIITTLRVIHNLQDEVENVSHWFASEILMRVVVDLIEMYKKIFEITVMYYISPGYISQKDFYNKVAKIISNDIGKIINYLCKEFVDSIFNEELTWQERICQSASILSIILIIKTSIDEMPNIFNFDSVKRNIEAEISSITLCLKAKIDVSE